MYIPVVYGNHVIFFLSFVFYAFFDEDIALKLEKRVATVDETRVPYIGRNGDVTTNLLALDRRPTPIDGKSLTTVGYAF